jgi:hypothetical protein
MIRFIKKFLSRCFFLGGGGGGGAMEEVPVPVGGTGVTGVDVSGVEVATSAGEGGVFGGFCAEGAAGVLGVEDSLGGGVTSDDFDVL